MMKKDEQKADLEGLAARESNKRSQSRAKKATKYTTVRANRICDFIANGNTMKAAAIASGICETTLHKWRREKPEFAQMVEEAVGISEVRLVNKITSSEDWRAALAILERRFPESWTKKQDVQVSVAESNGIEEIKDMIKQTDHLLNISRGNDEQKDSVS